MFGVGRLVLLRSLLVFGVTAATAASILVAARAGEPEDPRSGRRARTPHRLLSPERCEIAGSGSNLPLVRRLVDAYRLHHPADPVIVHDSVGSGGGARAALDGVVHLALLSRPLKDDERAAGLHALAHVRVPVVLGANEAVPDRSLPMARLLDLVAGRPVRWSDGSRAILLHRERTDSSNRVMFEASPPFRRAYEGAQNRTHWRVLFHETEMVQALAETPGSVGFVDLGVLRLSDEPLSMVRIDGRDPRAPDYPFLKELFFVWHDQPRGVAARLMAFIATPEAEAIARGADYRVLHGGHD